MTGAPRLLVVAALLPTALFGLGAAARPASAAPRLGWYDLGNNWTMLVVPSGDAVAYANMVFEPTPAEQKLNTLVRFLGRFTPWPQAVDIGRRIAYSGWRDVPKYRIYWCSWTAPYVRIYHWGYLPVWADPAW